MQRHSNIRAIVFVGIPAILLLGGCAARSASLLTVHTATAKRESIVKTLDISGVLAPDRTASVSSRVPGTARSVAVDVGQQVSDGQVLLQVDTREMDAQLRVAQAAVQAVHDQAAQAKLGIETAKTNLDLAQKSYDRINALFKSQAVSQSQLDDVESKLQLAKNAYQNANQQYELLSNSQLAQAEAQLNLIQVQIANGTITAPMSGIVTNRTINPGEVVNPSVPLFTIADTSVLRLQGNVSQDAIPLMSVGQSADVRVDGFPARTFAAAVEQIGPVGASTGQYFPVVFAMKNGGDLLAGMTAVATLRLSSPAGMVVPVGAIRVENGSKFVYVAGKEDGGVAVVKRIPITVGLQSAGDAQIIGNISEGDRVVDANVGTLSDGMSVRISSQDGGL